MPLPTFNISISGSVLALYGAVLSSLPVFLTSAVAFVLDQPGVVIATTNEYFKFNNGGGIWRSPDGGTTWKQVLSLPQSSAVPPPPRLTWEISIAPDSGNIYVAPVSCG